MTRYFARDPEALAVSVSAVIWRGQEARSELLLMQRSDNEHWGIPGGFVEPGESVEHAVIREVAEETGVQIAVNRLIGVYSDPATMVVAYPDGRRIQLVNLCFEARPVGLGVPTTPDETLASGYFALDALPEPFVPIHRVRIADAATADAHVRVR
jgi:ADP-ribose pyrophosphatase YjhB (NUDIX family)